MNYAEQLKSKFIQADCPFSEGVVDVFRQTISLTDVKKAVLTITALGIYEAYINGKKVGDILFAPGYSYYPRQLQIQSYDISSLLQKGDNELIVYLGQGWYCGRYTYNNKCQIYGEHSAVSWVLTADDKPIADSRGNISLLKSPYDYAGLYDGEVYHDIQLKPDNTKVVPYEGKLPETFEEGAIYTKIQEVIAVKSHKKCGDVTIIDFGQNFAGFVEIDPQFMNGTYLKLRHGELLNPDGSLYTANLRQAKQETVYYKGDSTKKYRPKFTFMGFRYVELSGVDYVPGLLTAYAIHSEMKATGQFSCSNKKVEKLFQNQIWGQRSNYLEVPTDCPQRDERMGYTGDCHVFAPTAVFNYDSEAFLAKFLKDIRYTQMDNEEGYVAGVVPALGPEKIGFITMLGWGTAVTKLPYLLWQQYGTTKYLSEQYESMKKHVDCEIRHFGEGPMGKENLWISFSLGDWLTPDKDVKYMAMHNNPASNAFVVNDLRIIAEAAAMLGKKEDAARYSAQLERTIESYVNCFVNEDGSMTDDYQGAYILALALVIPKGKLWDKCFAILLSKIKTEGMKTGFFSTAYLLPLLADNGQEKFAFDLLLNEECPGWLYQVNCGATTTWERWDALRPDGTVNEDRVNDKKDENMVSFNHYSFGSVGEFYYRYILGIQPLQPGYQKIKLRPLVDERLGSVEGSYVSRSGEIKVAWQVKDGTVDLQLVVPVETELTLPNGTMQTIEAGNHAFTVKMR